ncbi:LuxR C-terminal-related transcriptional regulator [Myroides sp. LJL115]
MILAVSQKSSRFLVLLLCLIISSLSIARVPIEQQEYIESLNYRPLFNSKTLQIATDSLNNNWIKGQIDEDILFSPLIFQIPNSHIFSYDLYAYNVNKLHLIPQNLDSRGEFVKSRFAHHYIVTDNTTYYLNLKQYPLKNLNILAQERSQFTSHEAKQLLYIGNYYGLATLTIFINFIFYFIFRDNRFLSYCALQIVIFISLFYEDGMFYYISDATWEMPYLQAWNLPLISLCICIFTLHFLDFKHFFLQYRTLFITLFILIFTLSLVFTFYSEPFLLDTIVLLSFIPPLFCLILTATQLNKNVYAKFLFLTFSTLLLVAMGYLLHLTLEGDIFSFFTINSVRLVCTFGILIITSTIIYKVKEIQNQNYDYRKEIENHLVRLDKSSTYSKRSKEFSPLDALRIKHNLTQRETEVLTCLWEGMSNTQISQKLFISVNTVKYHVNNLYNKLEIKNRTQAIFLKKSLSK